MTRSLGTRQQQEEARVARHADLRRRYTSGDTPEQICADTGRGARAIADFLRRRGDLELARPFRNLTNRYVPHITPPDVLAARKAEKHTQGRQRMLENLQWVVGTDSWESIARRFGYATAASFERSLRRTYNLPEWAARIERECTSPYATRRAA